eukprot:TRINITY_DN6350_c0_g1_i1.p1 TRINITY_DN6350_c0_g1~~TRINITY_DN6350_c0_g1_i1.p1  ORF type:complete len:555 (+),score=178.21 TRINITY_DN6350_c0_g1_i1:55-1719(+)
MNTGSITAVVVVSAVVVGGLVFCGVRRLRKRKRAAQADASAGGPEEPAAIKGRKKKQLRAEVSGLQRLAKQIGECQDRSDNAARRGAELRLRDEANQRILDLLMDQEQQITAALLGSEQILRKHEHRIESLDRRQNCLLHNVDEMIRDSVYTAARRVYGQQQSNAHELEKRKLAALQRIGKMSQCDVTDVELRLSDLKLLLRDEKEHTRQLRDMVDRTKDGSAALQLYAGALSPPPGAPDHAQSVRSVRSAAPTPPVPPRRRWSGDTRATITTAPPLPPRRRHSDVSVGASLRPAFAAETLVDGSTSVLAEAVLERSRPERPERPPATFGPIPPDYVQPPPGGQPLRPLLEPPPQPLLQRDLDGTLMFPYPRRVVQAEPPAAEPEQPRTPPPVPREEADRSSQPPPPPPTSAPEVPSRKGTRHSRPRSGTSAAHPGKSRRGGRRKRRPTGASVGSSPSTPSRSPTDATTAILTPSTPALSLPQPPTRRGTASSKASRRLRMLTRAEAAAAIADDDPLGTTLSTVRHPTSSSVADDSRVDAMAMTMPARRHRGSW